MAHAFLPNPRHGNTNHIDAHLLVCLDAFQGIVQAIHRLRIGPGADDKIRILPGFHRGLEFLHLLFDRHNRGSSRNESALFRRNLIFHADAGDAGALEFLDRPRDSKRPARVTGIGIDHDWNIDGSGHIPGVIGHLIEPDKTQIGQAEQAAAGHIAQEFHCAKAGGFGEPRRQAIINAWRDDDVIALQ